MATDRIVASGFARILAGDVGRAAVAGLVEARGPFFVQRRRGSMPIEPVSMAASSDRMSPNMLPVTSTSNASAP